MSRAATVKQILLTDQFLYMALMMNSRTCVVVFRRNPNCSNGTSPDASSQSVSLSVNRDTALALGLVNRHSRITPPTLQASTSFPPNCLHRDQGMWRNTGEHSQRTHGPCRSQGREPSSKVPRTVRRLRGDEAHPTDRFLRTVKIPQQRSIHKTNPQDFVARHSCVTYQPSRSRRQLPSQRRRSDCSAWREDDGETSAKSTLPGCTPCPDLQNATHACKPPLATWDRRVAAHYPRFTSEPQARRRSPGTDGYAAVLSPKYLQQARSFA